MANVQRTKAYGGSGGISFDDSHQNDAWGRISQIVVRHGNAVDAIGVAFANGNYISHGGTGGSETVIDLEFDEFITSVVVRYGARLDRITFVTNKRNCGPYGGEGGVEETVKFGDKVLRYLFGRAGARMDQIGFGFGDRPPQLPSTVVHSRAYGGTGGALFDDLAASGNLLGKVASLTVRHGARVDAIATQYKGGPTCNHGGGGGAQSTFNIEDNEWITEIRGRAGSRLDQIQFLLSSGRVSPVYGGTGGEPFAIQMDGHIVKALFGRSGNAIDQIGVYLEDAHPLQILIISMDFDVDQFKTVTMPPAGVMVDYLENRTDAEQEIEQALELAIENSTCTSVTETHGLSVTLKVEKDFKVAKAEFSAGYTYGHETATESTHTTSRTVTFTFSARVPPRSKIKATCLAREETFDIPWTATAQVTYQDRSEPVTQILHGVLRGVQVTALEAKYDPVQPLATTATGAAVGMAGTSP